MDKPIPIVSTCIFKPVIHIPVEAPVKSNTNVMMVVKLVISHSQ